LAAFCFGIVGLGAETANVPASQERKPTTADVKIDNFTFGPAELTVPVGTAVTWTNRDDLPQMRGIDGLKNGSPLGVEPKGEGINGKTGFSIAAPATGAAPATPKAVDSKKTETEPKVEEKKDTTTTTGDAGAKTTRVNAPLPVRPMLANLLANGQPVLIP
jgi:plastocyanin